MDDTDRVIITNHKTYLLREGEEGQPIEEAWPKAKIPDSLKGAKIYERTGCEFSVTLKLLV